MARDGIAASKRKGRQPDAGGGGDGVEAKRNPSSAEEEEGGRMDPLEVLGMDIMTRILQLSDACSVARCTVVSRGWHEVAVSDRLWGPKYMELLKGKAHIPRISNLRGASKLAAYSMSIIDGKRSAPEFWRNLDPSLKGTGPPMHRYFHPDGSHTADPGDEVWGGHECTYSIMTSYVGEGQIREHYVRINRWSPMAISRKEDWSWEMRNHICRYNSVPDAAKEGGTGPLFPAWY